MIMQDNEKKPALRFKGFTDPWEQRKLGELGTLKNGMNFSKAAMGIGYPFVNLQNIFGKNVVDISALGKAMASLGQLKDYSLLKGDVLFVRSSVKLEGVGEAALVPESLDKTTYSGFIIRFRDEEGIDNNYKRFVFATEQVRNQIISQATDSANKNISQSVLADLDVPLPELEEQSKIGQYFSDLDTLITLHQRKYEKLVNIKKSMLDKMFPQNGASVPEIRFKGFTDPWEQRKVREVTDRYDNLRIPVAASLRVAGTTPYYGANGIQDYVEGYTHDGEFILVAEDGANDLKNYPVKCVKGRIWVNNHAHVLQGKCACADNQFLAYAISQADIESLLVGGGRAKLNAETLMDIELLLPSKDEQIQIGHYLARLDHLITLHQRKLEKLQNIKKSCLEKMFV